MEHSNAVELSRIWVIEALASSKQCYMPALIDLVVRTPDLCADIGKNARELVCFKILETLSAAENQDNNEDPSGLHQKFEFDALDSCVDVLGHILRELLYFQPHKISASNFKLAVSQMLKCVKPFLADKRKHLPVIALQKLKKAILEGSNPVFASFKEQAGLETRSQFNDIPPGLDVSPSASCQILEQRNKDIQIVNLNQSICPNTTENGVGKLIEKLPGRHSLLSKRKRMDISARNFKREDQSMEGNFYDPHGESTKKFKQGTHLSENNDVPKSIKLVKDGLFANFSERIRKFIDKEGYNLENETEIGGMEMSHTEYPFDASKKLEQIVNVTEHGTVVKSTSAAGDEPLHNSSGRTIAHTNREGCNLEKEAEIGGMDMTHSDSTCEDGNQCASMMPRGYEISYASDGKGQLQNTMNGSVEVHIPMEVEGRNNCAFKVNDQMEVFEEKASDGASMGANAVHENVQGNMSTGCEANDGVEHNPVLEAAIDHDNFDDKRHDIASKKKAFLASQWTFREDSLATEPIFCMKCYGGGQLLICGTSTCGVVVHESCLGTAAKCDGDGRFYCPFCRYSRAISECLEAKKKATLASKDLATFMDRKIVCHMRPNVEENLQPKASTSVSGNGLPSGQIAEHSIPGVPEILKNANLHGEGKGQHCQSPIQPGEEENEVQAPQKYDFDISYHEQGDNGLPSGQTLEHSIHEEPETSGNEDLFVEGMGQQCQSPIQPRENQNEVQVTEKSDSEISSHKQADVPKRNQRQAGRRGGQKVKQPPESYLPSEPLNRTTSEISKEDVDKSPSKNPMSSGRPDVTYPELQLRRRRCHWTKLEEDKLKEGVEKLSSDGYSFIPWTAILEFGAGVFNKSRNACDLKVKWRNMMSKGGPKSN